MRQLPEFWQHKTENASIPRFLTVHRNIQLMRYDLWLLILLFTCGTTVAQPETGGIENLPEETASADTNAAETPVKIENNDENITDNGVGQTETKDPGFDLSGEGSLGWISNKGNTNNDSLNADLKINLEKKRWSHKIVVTAKKVRDEKIVTAERYLFTEKSDYTMSEHTYAFWSLRYDDDRFDGFEYQASASIGIGWKLLDREDHHFDLSLGAGYRQTELSLTGEDNDETIGRFSQHYDVRLSQSSELIQDLLVESGESNTTSEFTTAFKVSINGNLALKLSYNVKHNSNPPPGNVDRDRTTSANLVYGF